MIREQLEGPASTVTESKSLQDCVTGETREVDVVIQSRLDLEGVIVSIEVKAAKRRASVEWVEQQICKHQHLPTNQLILVSWSDFTVGARKKVASQSGKVVLAVPEVPAAASQSGQKFMVDEVMPTEVRRAAAAVRMRDGQLERVALEPGSGFFNADGTRFGTAQELMEFWATSGNLNSRLGDTMRVMADPPDEDRFVLTVPIHIPLYLHAPNEDKYQIEVLEVEWGMYFKRTSLELHAVRVFNGDYLYGQSETVAGKIAWLARESSDSSVEMLDWRPLP